MRVGERSLLADEPKWAGNPYREGRPQAEEWEREHALPQKGASLEPPISRRPAALTKGERNFVGIIILGLFGLIVVGAIIGIHGNDTPPTQKMAALTVQEVKAQAGEIGYDLLARAPTQYAGRLVTFQGQVIQTTQEGLSYTLRVNVTRGKYDIWKDTIWVDYRAGSGSEPRILEKDIITLWGEFVGIKSYKAVLGQTIQIPYVVARAVQPVP